ncbi:MAG: nascent polypeptide-associated complex protein [Candidatus Methanomethylicia archaeon]|jgi:nascent polypeptide-associated complex subunit alpha|nr:nascent polypeptide-associated complex protein [Candidatus Methanomethylicia archaeon]MCQ5340749.1 nascent polypeptide-associated complex protein [Candidatus Methanomethylicia archaeon]NHV45489.1 nascent polypeptide-associated complex protein [Candidatus Verstraetearchaeota archaeon]
MKRISPREARRLMQRMGMEVEEVQGIEEVLFIMKEKKIIIKNPQVMIMKIGGQKIYQVIGEEREEKEEEKIEIPEEDIQLVAAQTGKSIEEARRALETTKGDIAQAIILLTSK